MNKQKLICRAAKIDDDIASIAKYVHLTDPYIYPAITPNCENRDWISVFSECFETKGDIFYYENISVIELNDKIVGIICVIPCGKRFTFAESAIIPVSLENGVALTRKKYFAPLFEENAKYRGYNITNICIDTRLRGKGLGSKLLTYCIEKYGSEDIQLDVIKSNTAAIGLYKKHGFEMCAEYFGFSGEHEMVLCYRMKYAGKKSETAKSPKEGEAEMIEIHGKSITLRTVTQKEMRALWRKYEPEDGASYVYNEEEADKLFEQSLEHAEWNPSVGIFTKTDEIIGLLTFERIVYSENRCDISLFLANEGYRGKGYGTEAVMLAKKYAKEGLNLKRIYADVSENNARMKAVMKKCGFQNTKTYKADMPDGSDRLVYFALL